MFYKKKKIIINRINLFINKKWIRIRIETIFWLFVIELTIDSKKIPNDSLLDNLYQNCVLLFNIVMATIATVWSYKTFMRTGLNYLFPVARLTDFTLL